MCEKICSAGGDRGKDKEREGMGISKRNGESGRESEKNGGREKWREREMKGEGEKERE